MIHSQPPLKIQNYSLLSASRWTVVLSIALATSGNVADPDLWMHILTGQTTLRTGHIPRFDPYSYTAAGMPWHNHEWLAQVALAFSYAHLGVFGLKLLKLLCSTIMIIALAIGISASRASSRIQRLTLIVAAVGLATQMQFRPQLFTFMLLSIVMTLIATEVYRAGAMLWPLIPMFALWANLHGGYTIGLGAMITAVAVLSIQSLGNPRHRDSARRLGLVTLGCAVATLLNPFGIGAWTEVAHSVSDPLIRQLVNDWMPLPSTMLLLWQGSKRDLLQYIAPLFLFAGFFAATVMAPGRDDAALSAIAAVFIGGAFYATRNVALAIIATAIPLARHATLALQPSTAIQPEHAGPSNPAPGDEPLPALLAVAALLVTLVGGTFSNRLKTWEPMPAGAVAFMEHHRLHGNILNQYEYGDYLAWHVGNFSRVFIDGRCEVVYPDSLIRQYAIFFFGLKGADDVLEAFPHDFVLISPHTKGYQVVKKNSRWQLIYSDATAALFARASLDAVPAGAQIRAPSVNDHAADTYFP